MAQKHFQEIVIWASKDDNLFDFLKVPAFSSLHKKKERKQRGEIENEKWKTEIILKVSSFNWSEQKRKKGKKKSHHI
jgi:hypothetical protein